MILTGFVCFRNSTTRHPLFNNNHDGLYFCLGNTIATGLLFQPQHLTRLPFLYCLAYSYTSYVHGDFYSIRQPVNVLKTSNV